jgi:hypothetical protein
MSKTMSLHKPAALRGGFFMSVRENFHPMLSRERDSGSINNPRQTAGECK